MNTPYKRIPVRMSVNPLASVGLEACRTLLTVYTRPLLNFPRNSTRLISLARKYRTAVQSMINASREHASARLQTRQNQVQRRIGVSLHFEDGTA
jgi:hypothetical protein